jgi:N-acetyl-gamma-glutamyl-phosphate reductase
MAYGLKTHRHTIEIQQMASRLSGQMVMVQFTPHLLPVDRGILTAVYAFPVREITEKALRKLYHDMYDNEPFIRVRSQAPSLKNVRGTNLVDVFPVYDERTGHIMVFSAIDNLVKGAAGQAVQNMNVMLGIDETSGLETFPLQP